MRRVLVASITMSALLAGMSGCTHYHFYGQGAPVCETPATAAAAQPMLAHQYGSVCEVPPSSNATVISGIPGGTRVLVSQPQGPRRLLSSPGTRFAWRRP